MSQKEKAMETYKMADEFIDLANRMLTAEGKELEDVGAAIRYAAARFSSHEVAYRSKDLAAEKREAVEWYTGHFNEMLTENFDQHIEHIAAEKEKAAAESH